MRRTPFLLACASAVALAAGLAPMASRWYQEHAQRTRAEAQQAQVRQEAEAQKAELQARRPEILAELTQLQAAGEHDKVLALAGRYRLASDAEVRAIHARSAQELSLRQTLDRMAALAAEHCTEPSARRVAETLFTEAYPDAGAQPAQAWTLQQLPLPEFVEPMRTRIREWASIKPSESHEHEHGHGHSHAHEAAESPLEALRGDHAPRINPAVGFAIMRGLRVDGLACVWRVKGEAVIPQNGQNVRKPFELRMWMAPSATERGLERDVFSVQGL